MYDGRAELAQHLDTYKIGDKVFHLYGSKYTVVLPKSKDSDIQCAVCGDSNVVDNCTCRSCGYTLIKNMDMLR